MSAMQMRTEGPIRTRRAGAILEVTLDRPKANAITKAALLFISNMKASTP